MRPFLLFVFALVSSGASAQQQEMEIGTDPYLFRDADRSFTYEPHGLKTTHAKTEGDTNGLFLSLFENLSSKPLLRITRPGPLKGYPTIISVEESGMDHYILVQKIIGVPCSSDALDTAFYLVEKRDQLDSALMNEVFNLVRIAINKEGRVNENNEIPARSEHISYITVVERSRTYLTGAILRTPTSVRNDRLNRFISLSDDFLWHINDFNKRRHADYLNKIRFLIREYETGIPSPDF